MKLTASPTSPYARKIRVLLAEKGLDFDMIEDSPWEADTGVPRINPLGKVPVLETDDGQYFFDSPVIAGYLEVKYPEPVFIPADPMEAVHVRQTEALADGITDAALLIRLETLRPMEAQLRETVERQQGKIERGLEALEAKLPSKEHWFHGHRISLADIAAGCALEYLDFRLAHLNWRQRFPHLKELALRIGARNSFLSTRPD